jgi:hypothetical protein
MFRAVRCAHVSQPLASNPNCITAVAADTFKHAGCLFLLSVRGYKVGMRINAEPSQHGFCPSFKRIARMSGCQFTLEANGSGSFAELRTVAIVRMAGVDKLMSENIKNPH